MTTNFLLPSPSGPKPHWPREVILLTTFRPLSSRARRRMHLGAVACATLRAKSVISCIITRITPNPKKTILVSVDKINHVIEDLYNLRNKLKTYKNPAERVIKLLMNSMYGKTIIKPIETDTVVKYSQEDFEKINYI